jgi:small subunit ribosomal protein S2
VGSTTGGSLTKNGDIMPKVTAKDLVDAGAHFGHRTRMWNPKMKKYIHGERNGIHIINLRHTAVNLLKSLRFLTTETSRGKKVLFVGTKRSASDVVAEHAKRCGMYYVNHRWLGGTLTNFKTISASVKKLIRLEKDMQEGRLENRTKKERLNIEKEMRKMEMSFGGIKEMKGLPDIMFVIDPKREHIAIKEANRLKIPVIALCDTNCNPDGVDFVIPANDDAIKSLTLFTSLMAEAVLEGQQGNRRSSKTAETE